MTMIHFMFHWTIFGLLPTLYLSWRMSFRKWEGKLCFWTKCITGSSLLEIHKGEADLSRRAVTYHLHGLSFREFLQFEYGYKMEVLPLSDILTKHIELAMNVSKQLKPLVAFNEYLTYGYFPFYKEDKILYHERLLAILNTILDVDLPSTEKIDYYSIGKIKKTIFHPRRTCAIYSQYINAQQRNRSQSHQSVELSILSPKGPSPLAARQRSFRHQTTDKTGKDLFR